MKKADTGSADLPNIKDRGIKEMDNETISNFRTMRNAILTDEVISLKNDRDRLLSKLERIVTITEQAIELVNECPKSCERLRDRIDHIRVIAVHCK